MLLSVQEIPLAGEGHYIGSYCSTVWRACFNLYGDAFTDVRDAWFIRFHFVDNNMSWRSLAFKFVSQYFQNFFFFVMWKRFNEQFHIYFRFNVFQNSSTLGGFLGRVKFGRSNFFFRKYCWYWMNCIDQPNPVSLRFRYFSSKWSTHESEKESQTYMK